MKVNGDQIETLFVFPKKESHTGLVHREVKPCGIIFDTLISKTSKAIKTLLKNKLLHTIY